MSKGHSSGNLLVVERKSGPLYYAKWRDSTRRQVKRRLGPAWVERDAAGDWHKRRGRVPEGYLDEKAAYVEMHRLIEEHEAELAKPRPDRYPTFNEAAADWLHRLEHIDGAKPSTLGDYRLMLAEPDAEPRRRGKRTARRIMAEFGGQELRSITTRQVERFLARLDDEGVSKRTVNKHRQVVRSILEHAARRPEQYGTTVNVASATAKRREPPPSDLDYYEAEEVLALARAAADGRHRDSSRRAASENEQRERRPEPPERRRRRQPRSRAKVRRRGNGALATAIKLTHWRACSIAPSSWSRSVVHEGHGASASGSRAVSPSGGPGRSSAGSRGNMKL